MARPFLSLILGAVVALGTVTAVSLPAAAQDIRAQVQRLQQELKTLQQRVYGGSAGGQVSSGSTTGGASGSPSLARLELRMGQLETQMRSLTGEIEQVGWRIDQATRRLDQVAADLESRLQRLEQQSLAGAGALAPSGEQPTSLTMPAAQSQTGAQTGAQIATQSGAPAAGGGQLAPGETGPKTLGAVSATNLDSLRAQAERLQSGQASAGTAAAQSAAQSARGGNQAAAGTQTAAAGGSFASARAQYDQAFNLLSQANYPAAERALADFIAAHPTDPLAGNAKYWLGETYYVRGDYRNAAVTFAEGFQDYPNSAKAPDNLLKLGKSLAALNQTNDACGTLSELARRYPDAPQNVQQQANRERQRLSCP